MLSKEIGLITITSYKFRSLKWLSSGRQYKR